MTFDTRGRQPSGGGSGGGSGSGSGGSSGSGSGGGSNTTAPNVGGVVDSTNTGTPSNTMTSTTRTNSDSTTTSLTNSSGSNTNTITTTTTTINIGHNTSTTLGGVGVSSVRQLQEPPATAVAVPIVEMSTLTLQASTGTGSFTSTTSSSTLVLPTPVTTALTTSTAPSMVVVVANDVGSGGGVGGNGGAITSADSVSPEKLLLIFPTMKLRSLTQKISNPRWVVPVLPEQELELLLNAAIALTVAGVDHDSEPCVEFYRNALSTSFSKILTDEAVNSWKYNIHHCILMSCGKLLNLIAIHMQRDNPYLLELLAMVFDPDNKFNTFNAVRQPECFAPPDSVWGTLDASKGVYAKPPPEPKNPRGWLVDLINRFGQLGGFDQLLERFNAGLLLLRRQQQEASGSGGDYALATTSALTSLLGSDAGADCILAEDVTPEMCRLSAGSSTTVSGTSGHGLALGDEQDNRLTLSLIYSLLRPFGQCYELLTVPTIAKYFKPIWNVVLDLLDSFSDDELKREVKPEGRNDYINGIVKSARLLASRLPGQEELIRDLEMFRLKMILRLLQVSSFNGKMNALNEINKVLTSVSYYAHRPQQLPHCLPDDEMDWLTAERMACWIKDSDVLGIVLKDSLHQPQYVEKLEKIIRFLIKERALTLEDLDAVWRAQAGKHEAIVKNVHDLLAKLAWDFTPEQLDHLFESFQASMTTANKRQRERLLELIRRLAEDDKNGVMAQKVLKLFWTLAHSQEIPPEVLDAALVAHVKILDYSCSQERDAQKIVWLEKCVAELKQGDDWVLPALRLIREICCLYESSPSLAPRAQQTLNRQQVIERLQNEYSLVILVTNSLTAYMDRIRRMLGSLGGVSAVAALEPRTLCIDGRYPHTMQIQDRLDFLKFLLKDGQLWLCADQAKQIWHCLAVNAVFASDREECFRWFGKLMGEEPDLDPGINKDFFEHNILQLEPHLLTESGIKCFERFFKAVNSKEDKLKATQRGYILDNEDLIGKDYLWRVITTGGEEIAAKAIDLLKEVSTALGPRLQENICEFHEMFIGECCERLRTHYSCILILGRTASEHTTNSDEQQDGDCDADAAAKDHKMRCIEAEKMCRILKVLQEYIKECDRSFNGDRLLLPLGRVGRGKHTSLYIRFQNPGRPLEDHELTTHNNETVASFKRQLLKRINKGGAGGVVAAATVAGGTAASAPGGGGGAGSVTTAPAIAPATAANVKIDLYYNNGEPIEISDEINPLSHYSIRDKMILTAKLSPLGGGGTAAAGLASSPDSSSDSSTGSPPRPCPDVARVESESTLPGVIIAQRYQYIEFFLKLYQLGCDLEHGRLRESARTLLHLLPCDRRTVRMVQIMCRVPGSTTTTSSATTATTTLTTTTNATTKTDADVVGDAATLGASTPPQESTPAATTTAPNSESLPPIDPLECTPEMLFLHPSPSQVLYNLGVLNGLLIPALDPFGEAALQIQSSWLHSGCAHFILELLTKNNFLPNADMYTKRTAFQCVLRLARLFLYVMGCVLSRVGDEPLLVGAGSAGSAELADIGARSQVELLKLILVSIPSSAESAIRTISSKLAEQLAAEMLSASVEGERCRQLFASTLRWACPDTTTIKAAVQLAWASSCGRLQALGSCTDFGDDITMPDPQDFTLCKEALEVFTIALVLNPSANEALSADPIWPKFITSLILKSPSRHVRQYAAEQLYLSCTYCAGDRRPFAYMVQLLVSSLRTLVPQHEATCADFFQLLCRTLSYGCVSNWPLNVGEGLLAEEIAWLRKIRENVRQTGDIGVHEDLLEGHLYLAKELMFFLTVETKAQLTDLIHELIDDFLFTASREYLHLRKQGRLKHDTAPPPVCRSSHTIAAGCDLLIALCQNSVTNMKLVTNTIIDFVCTDTEPLREWDYIPPVGARPPKGFCGLKNAGATCYMNSVLQQLYMVLSIRVGILRADGAATNDAEDFSGEPDTSSAVLGSSATAWPYGQLASTAPASSDATDGHDVRQNYHVVILKHVQAIFAHLGHSSLQYYVPRGLWTHFKLQGEPVNLREQQDAVEFFMSLFESLDEGLKALGQTQLMNATLGGSFSDQKICQECPHRYSKEEPFSVFSVDIRNHSSLTESLEQYVKGELLEGADAYHCDKCDKKVVTIKRLCVRKLPPVLAIQLKRFEYDYERVCAIKFNDYFEFPRVLDMEPYTVSGLAKLEGEVIEIGENCQSNGETTKYELTGIVVHSGQASGGHYFSYILSKNPSTGKEQWYKFDDGEVTECKMHEDEEMKAQCFGGDYMGEIYDNNLKRMQYRRQKRWWNAYMLFYTRCDQRPVQFEQSVEQLSLAESKNFVLPLPKPIERSVRNQNIRFLHSKSIFSVEFFMFIRKLVTCIVPSARSDKMSQSAEELSLLGVQLASQFLFHTGFRTKKAIRGPVIDWYDTLSHHIRGSPLVRKWFASNALLNPPSRLGEYILMAPSPEVRTVFVKLVVFFCHFAIVDEPLPGFEGGNLCEQVLIGVLRLLKSEVADHGKNLPHYFSLFSMYVGLGIHEKHQLLKLNVPVIFMQVALDEGPGPSIKFQYPELSKLHQVVSHLIRCSDVSDKCQSLNQIARPLPNPYKDPAIGLDELLPLSPESFEILFSRTGYIKKLIEDTNVGEEGLKLLQYCSWENPHFSRAVLTELLWQCGFAYCHDMRHHTELLLHILLIEDSWQHHRIHNALNGVAEEREGLLETIHRTKTHYQKRAYQIIKCLTQLFHKSPVALTILNTNAGIARQWVVAVEWLQDELDRQRGIGCQYNSYSWSPPAQSNDNTNGYMLERSQSAKNTWTMAYELCPEEEQEETIESDIESGETSGDTGEYIAPNAVAGGPGRKPVLVWKNNSFVPTDGSDEGEVGGSGGGSSAASSSVTSSTTTTVAGSGGSGLATTTAISGNSDPTPGAATINGLPGNLKHKMFFQKTYTHCIIGETTPGKDTSELVDVQLTPPSAPTADSPAEPTTTTSTPITATPTTTATPTITPTPTTTPTATSKSASTLTAGGVGGAGASAASASAKSKSSTVSYYSVNNLTNTTALLQSLSTTAAALTASAATTTNKAAAAAAAAAANATTAALTATSRTAPPLTVPVLTNSNSSSNSDAKKSTAEQQTLTQQQIT